MKGGFALKKTRARLIGIALSLLMITLCACSPAEQSPAAPEVSPATPQTEESSPTPVEEPANEIPFTLYADFTAGYTWGDVSEPLQTKAETTTQPVDAFLLAERLSQWSGLDFTLNSAELDGEEIRIDWDAASTLVAGLDRRDQKEDFFFIEAESMNWFMMDSLARTLTENLPVHTVYYSADGGNALILEMQGLRTLPVNEPYAGSAFYIADSHGPAGTMKTHSLYKDTENRLLISYPTVFSEDGALDDNGYMRFPSLQDDTALLYWVTPNTYGEDKTAFMDRMSLIEGRALVTNVVIGGVESMDQDTGEISFEIGFWVVEDDYIVNILIVGETPETAGHWYEELATGAVLIDATYRKGNATAMELLSDTIAHLMVEGTVLSATGEDEVEGVHAYTFSFRTASSDAFTAEQHFAVDDNGQIWLLDILENQYIPYAVG
jgi:hypothetical protein